LILAFLSYLASFQSYGSLKKLERAIHFWLIVTSDIWRYPATATETSANICSWYLFLMGHQTASESFQWELRTATWQIECMPPLPRSWSRHFTSDLKSTVRVGGCEECFGGRLPDPFPHFGPAPGRKSTPEGVTLLLFVHFRRMNREGKDDRFSTEILRGWLSITCICVLAHNHPKFVSTCICGLAYNHPKFVSIV